MEKILNAAGRTVTIFCGEGGSRECERGEGSRLPVIFLNAVQNEGRAVYEACMELGAGNFALAAVDIVNWNDDMSPWKEEAVMKNAKPFAGGADKYLKELIGEILPQVESKLPDKPLYYGLAGYSLGGLFALYSAYRTDTFSKIASESGSLWFPGFVEYVGTHGIKAAVQSVYISLGKLESKTRNPVMSKVEADTKQIVEYYRAEGIDVTYEENAGNHFHQPALRTAKGIVRLLEK